jgi:hypothetical protein
MYSTCELLLNLLYNRVVNYWCQLGLCVVTITNDLILALEVLVAQMATTINCRSLALSLRLE